MWGLIFINLSYNADDFYNFVAGTGFCFTGLLLLHYLCRIPDDSYRIPWVKIEVIFCAIWTLFYLIASCMAFAYLYGDPLCGLAAFVGICAMLAYASTVLYTTFKPSIEYTTFLIHV
ncbi:hypothetical protein MTP99_010392 [Tenebrio molitor]|jgi:hypothetical protein|nr:hypothetical protein MTP99_010392 [Tenebrio molitor]